jgi:hypothetical protein
VLLYAQPIQGHEHDVVFWCVDRAASSKTGEHQLRQRLRAFITLSVASVMTLTASATAMAADPTQPAPQEGITPAVVLQQINDVQGFWAEAGVPAKTRAVLEQNLREHGTLPLSMTSAKAIDSDVVKQDGNFVTTETFADGSVSVALVQYEAGEPNFDALGPAADEVTAALQSQQVSPMASTPGTIKGCRQFAGSGYVSRYDCAVAGSSGVVNIGFLASYTITQGANNDRIFDHNTPYQQCNGAVCDMPQLAAYRANENAVTGKALVRYTARWVVVEVSSGTAQLQLTVGGNAASASLSK